MPTSDGPIGHLRNIAGALVDALDDAALLGPAIRLRPHLVEESARLLDAREVAHQLGLHPETVSRMARSGRIEAVKIGREWRLTANRLGVRPMNDARASVAPTLYPRFPRAGPEVERTSVAAIRGRVWPPDSM